MKVCPVCGKEFKASKARTIYCSLECFRKSRIKDLTGRRFGKLVVIEMLKKGKAKCVCDCGNTKIIATSSLKAGLTKSCGCVRKEISKEKMQTHKLTNSRLYSIYKGMKERCNYKKHKEYSEYGKRGITVCKEWGNDFMNFYNWAMANGYKDNLTIDRINNNKGYSPENCRWATYKEQCNNTRKNNFITYNNQTHSLTEWAEILGIKRSTLSSRIHRSNWSIEKAFTSPEMVNQFSTLIRQ